MRPTKRRHPQFEALEGKALLSAVHPLSHRPVTAASVHALQSNDQNNNGNGGGNNNGGLSISNQSFSLRNAHTNFNETITAGGYRFRQTYSMQINRIRCGNNNFNNQGGGLTGRDAIDQFFADLNNRLDQFPNGGRINNGGFNPGNGVFTVDRENFRFRGSRVTYDITYNSGGYRFIESYTLNVNRDRNNPQTGTLTARDAIDQFETDLNNRLDQLPQFGGGQNNNNGGQNNNGGGNGTA